MISDITDFNVNAQKMVTFKAGTDDDFVHSYKLQFLDENRNAVEFDEIDYDDHIVHYNENGDKIRFDNDDYEKGSSKKLTEVLFFSDFVLGLDNMSDTAELRLPSTLPENIKYISVTAIDSWGAESNTVICEVK